MQLFVYFCSKIVTNLKQFGIFMLLCLFLGCHQGQQEKISTPWGDVIGEEADTTSFDLDDIERSGELIALTLSGPETHYDYHGRQLGAHTMLCQLWADHLGVRLRMEVCRDTAELLSRLHTGEADVIAFPMKQDSVGPGWVVDSTKTMLTTSLKEWYQPNMLAEVRQEEQRLLKGGGVKRRGYAPMLNRRGGIISRYDALFQKYNRSIGWDWRLMAAQCYQESTIDPMAHSWAGAKGLMQIMPSTADHLGLDRTDMHHPEKNIAAAARYIKELENSFSDIGNRHERQDFILAAYNGGYHHIRDAMALAQRDGKNPYRWSDVSYYVLHLSEPQYYQDPIVKNGYMRGSETYDYVQSIRKRWQQYRGVKGAVSGMHQKSQNERHRKKFQLQPND
jgi:membrane-bound lytic murein transglycosylase F